MKAFRALLGAELRAFLRDKAALTFTFLFPLLFIVIFGFLMSGIGSTDDARLGIAVSSGLDDGSLEAVIAEVGSLRLTAYASARDLQTAIEARDVDFGVVWDGASLTFFYDVRRTQENFAFEEVARGIASRFDLARQGGRPLIRVEQVAEGGEGSVDWLTLVVPGILAFSVLSAGLFAVAGHLTSMKQRKLLDRLVVTPMRPTSLLAAIVAVRLGVAFLSTLITLVVAVALFRLQFRIDWVRYVVLLVSAMVGTMGMGTLIALVVRQPSSASNVANVVSMIMMFVSGIYFPIEIMPAFLRAVSTAMPLRYMADAMRSATGVMDMTATRFWTTCGALLGMGILLLPVLGRYVVRADRR